MTQTTVPVIFDLDGTLVDPAGGIADGIAAALTEPGLGVPDQALLDAMIGPKLSHSLTDIAVATQKTEGIARTVLEHQGIAALFHTLMAGDRVQDVAGAAANGIDCIGVGWGFAPDGELDAAGAVEIVHSSAALHETISGRDPGRANAVTPHAVTTDPMTDAVNEVHTDGNV